MFASFTLAELESLRDEVKAAYQRSLRSVSYGISTRNLSRAQPEQLFRQLQRLEAEIASRGGSQIVQAAFPDDYGDLQNDTDGASD